MKLTNHLSSYVKVMRIGQGAFGDVWLAEDLTRKQHVALKKLISKESRDGFSKTAIREIILLTHLKHKNIVKFYGVVFSRPRRELSERNTLSDAKNTAQNNTLSSSLNKGSVWMVFEYLPYDLSGYIEGLKLEGKIIRIVDIKVIVRQLLSSLKYCHINNTIHRDIKCANLLISGDGVVKLADFGLARVFSTRNRMFTNRVVTLWYRPPELLLGSQCYDYPVDMWSVGCILGELILQHPLFCSETEAGVLKSIGETLGSPHSDVLVELKKLPLWSDRESNPLLQMLGSGKGSKYKQFTSRVEEKVGKQGLDLLLSLLQYSPESRLTACRALEHPWLNSSSTREAIPDRLDMSVFSKKKQFHSLSARKLRDKLQGRLKAPSPSEIGGALNAVIGKAYCVGPIKETIAEEMKASVSENLETSVEKQEADLTNDTNSVLADENKFKTLQGKESCNKLDCPKEKRNSDDHINPCEKDRKCTLNTHNGREVHGSQDREMHEKNSPRVDAKPSTRGKEPPQYDQSHPYGLQRNNEVSIRSYSNLSQHITPLHSPPSLYHSTSRIVKKISQSLRISHEHEKQDIL
ncbi:putative cdc2-related protein kinase [Cryptosporidium canis]|uniref:Cyclin-dependent kinase 2 homolog n=1 Tax=Cryptosporidium canis TaxID=195482 RepID=A0A9D5DLE0_9CRYT|nr:putative cdc2-related protein kinase [Cryptosporidium canis]